MTKYIDGKPHYTIATAPFRHFIYDIKPVVNDMDNPLDERLKKIIDICIKNRIRIFEIGFEECEYEESDTPNMLTFRLGIVPECINTISIFDALSPNQKQILLSNVIDSYDYPDSIKEGLYKIVRNDAILTIGMLYQKYYSLILSNEGYPQSIGRYATLSIGKVLDNGVLFEISINMRDIDLESGMSFLSDFMMITLLKNFHTDLANQEKIKESESKLNFGKLNTRDFIRECNK